MATAIFAFIALMAVGIFLTGVTMSGGPGILVAPLLGFLFIILPTMVTAMRAAAKQDRERAAQYTERHTERTRGREHAHKDEQGHLDFTCGTEFSSPSCEADGYDYHSMLGEGFEEDDSPGAGFED